MRNATSSASASLVIVMMLGIPVHGELSYPGTVAQDTKPVTTNDQPTADVAASACSASLPIQLLDDLAKREKIAGSTQPIVERDYAHIAELFKVEASHGSSTATFALGYLTEHGMGVPKDYSLAMAYYKAAAEGGNATAANNIGAMYEAGRGVPVNLREAARWYRSAAEHGDPNGEENLAALYFVGKGVHRDYEQAASWLLKAAEQNDAPAQAVLAYMYATGKGLHRDSAEAARWARRAADQGNPQGQAELASLYERGTGVPLDYVRAYRLYLLSFRGGNETIKKRMDDLSRIMTLRQIREATRVDVEETK